MIDEKLINKFGMKEMLVTQLTSWELILKKKDLKEATINRKISDVGLFYLHMKSLRDNGQKVEINNINNILFEYVRDGYFSSDNLENLGTYSYRRAIHRNIREGFNYIYEDYFKGKKVLIDELSDEQKKILDDVSQNNYFRMTNIKDDKETIQTKLIEELGIKVYFDEENKPYVYSHELAELINRKNKNVMRDILKIKDQIDKLKLEPICQSTDFSIADSKYIDDMNREQDSLIIYKDLLIKYLLGLNLQGENKNITLEFQLKYIDAFNYIEKEYTRLLEENMQLKESFMEMYNQLRKRNRDLLVVDNNKKCKKKKSA